MLPRMALTQSDLDRLDAAIATGELEVSIDGKTIKYRGISELMRARNHVAAQLSASGGGRPRSVFYFTPSGRRD